MGKEGYTINAQRGGCWPRSGLRDLSGDGAGENVGTGSEAYIDVRLSRTDSHHAPDHCSAVNLSRAKMNVAHFNELTL